MIASNAKLIFITHRTSHHALHSGTEHLIDGFPAIKISGKGNCFIPWRIQKLIIKKCQQSYDTYGLKKELFALSHLIKRRGGILHFLHGERDYHFSGYWAKKLKWRLLAGFHLPPEQLRQVFIRKEILKRLDGVFCVSTNQMSFFKDFGYENKIWHLPLGIDTNFFSPGNNGWENNECLFVGHHLRDFERLGRLWKALKSRFNQLKLTAIIRKEFKILLPALPGISVQSGISDQELRKYYQKSALLLMPFKDVTACTALLEAMACGLPIVTNDVGGIRDYVDSESSFVCSDKDEEMIEKASILLVNNDLNKQMRFAARRQGEMFSWLKVRNQLADIYKKNFNFDPLLLGFNIQNTERLV